VVDVAIQDYVVDVATELVYQNKSQISKEVLFVFPLSPHMSIYSFEAHSEDAKVQATLQEEAQQLHEATGGWENMEYLQDQSEYPGEVFACFLGTLSSGRELVVTLRYVQELSQEPDGGVRFVLPPTLHPHTKHYGRAFALPSAMFLLAVWNCRTRKLVYSLLLTATLQSPRGVANVQANFALSPLIFTTLDRSTARVSLAGSPPSDHDLELLVYFGELTAVSAMVEKGDPEAPPGSLLHDPMVLVKLAPSIPEVVPGQRQSGEFIFLLDTTFLECAQVPWQSGDQDRGSLLFLLKSLPLGCYFNIYCYEETSEGIYAQSVEYTQDNLTQALQCIPSTGSSLGDNNLLGALRSIYNSPQPHGHTLQLFIFMAGLPPDKEAIAAEVFRHRNSHRCFSFCFSEDSAALAMVLARETGGEAAYVSSDNRMIVVVLKCLKQALKPAAEGVSLSWTLPRGLEVEVLGGTPQSIFQGQHRLLYAQIHGQAEDTTVAKGIMTLQYSLNGQDVTHTIEFPLCPQGDGRLAGHRLAARCLLKDLLPEAMIWSGDESRQRAVEISLTLGIICPFTSYVGVRTSQRISWYRGPLALLPPHQSVVPCKIIYLPGSHRVSSCFPVAIWVPPGWLTTVSQSWLALRRLTHGIAGLSQRGACSKVNMRSRSGTPREGTGMVLDHKQTSDKMSIADCQELVALQNVDGSWALSSGLASVLEVDEAEIKGKMPGEVMEPSIWATVLAVTWLHRHNKCYRDFCELLEAKAVTWLCSRAVSQLDKCLEAANTLLGCSVKPSVFRL
ncbi:VMA5A protein, partial [Galbula dea]|nr:VMA5A protein [Galbula dea]